MQILYTTHHSLANLQGFPPLFSWLLLLGAVYGFLRLLHDVLHTLVEFHTPAAPPPSETRNEHDRAG